MADIKGQVKSGIDTAADKAKDAADKGQGYVDRAREGAQNVMDKAGDYAGQARDKAGEWAGDARDAARQAGDKVQKWAGDAYDYASENAGDFGREVTSMIRRHPVPAVLIGFGIGLLLGRTARVI